MLAIGKCLNDQYEALATPIPPHLAARVKKLSNTGTGIAARRRGYGRSPFGHEAKRAELVHELVPKAATIALLVDPNFPSADEQTRVMQEAASSLGLNLLVVKAGTAGDLDRVFATLAREGVGALVVAASGLSCQFRVGHQSQNRQPLGLEMSRQHPRMASYRSGPLLWITLPHIAPI